MLQHQNSMDSSNSMSIGDIRGALTESSDPEKKMLSIQYDALSIADIGGRRILKSRTYYLPLPLYLQLPVRTSNTSAHIPELRY